MDAITSQPVLTEVSNEVALSPTVSNSDTAASAEKAQIKGLLAEARNTREMLLEFKAAVESGEYQGHKMLALAKGVSFLVAIINQNSAHIDNLQERLK